MDKSIHRAILSASAWVFCTNSHIINDALVKLIASATGSSPKRSPCYSIVHFPLYGDVHFDLRAAVVRNQRDIARIKALFNAPCKSVTNTAERFGLF
jgi:hypothetical protein